MFNVLSIKINKIISILFAFLSALSSGYTWNLAQASDSPTQKVANFLVPTQNAPKVFPKKTEVASFAAGCFWGVEQEFRKQKGVLATAVGFMGGHVKNPTYRQVCDENTGHAETVQVEYDPQVISYQELLDVFWHLHNPTLFNRQGPDIGDQYRSAIFCHTPEQKTVAMKSRDQLQSSGELEDKVVTEITSASDFYKAEAYHQQYVEKGGHASCAIRRRK